MFMLEKGVILLKFRGFVPVIEALRPGPDITLKVGNCCTNGN
jgi:hypothetical protein